MAFQLYPGTVEDIPAVVQVASQSCTKDTHTHLKAIAKGYGPTSEDTACYHSQGMQEGYLANLNDPARHLIVAKSPSGEILGSIVWVMKGYEGAQSESVKLSNDASTLSILPPPSPPPPTLPRTVPNLEIVTNAAMKHYISHLMPPGTRCRYISGINVSPAYQNLGVGSALVNWGLERARSENVFCWVSSSMAGVPIFGKSGFKEVGRLEVELDDWAEGIKKPILRDGSEDSEVLREESWGKYIWTWMKWTP